MMKFVETTLNCWEDIFSFNSSRLYPFIFRGQSNCIWDLETSIERNSYDFCYYRKTGGYKTEEKWMLDEFKKKYHLYSNSSAFNNEDSFEWLAIMQHHGAPTRLLDFTKSLYIAAYFAVVNSSTDSVIWGINVNTIRDNIAKKYSLPYEKGKDLKDIINLEHINYANQIIARDYPEDLSNPKTVLPLEPKYYTERLARQQGLFLMPANSSYTFMENLTDSFDTDNISFDKCEISQILKLAREIKILRIILPSKIHESIIESLNQMNITTETLFPGIDGLAKSLLQKHIRKNIR